MADEIKDLRQKLVALAFASGEDPEEAAVLVLRLRSAAELRRAIVAYEKIIIIPAPSPAQDPPPRHADGRLVSPRGALTKGKSFKLIKSQYAGLCIKCDRYYVIGDSVFWARGVGAFHKACLEVER